MAFRRNALHQELQALRTDINTCRELLDTGFAETRRAVDTARQETAAVSLGNLNDFRNETRTRFSDTDRAVEIVRDSVETVRRDLLDLRALLESWMTQVLALREEVAKARAADEESGEAEDDGATPAASSGDAGSPHAGGSGDDTEDGFHQLLDLAAGITFAQLVCHRDTWAFLVEESARGEHFRLPAGIEEQDDGTMRVAVSGRTLLAVIDALWHVVHRSETTAPSKALAWRIYRRIQDALQGNEPDVDGPVTRVVIDDRPPGQGPGSGEGGESRTPPRPPAPRKPPARKRATAKKAAPRSTTAKKATAKKTVARKTAGKKAVARKTTPRMAAAPRTEAAQKTTARKATPRQTTVQVATAKKTAAKRASPRRSA